MAKLLKAVIKAVYRDRFMPVLLVLRRLYPNVIDVTVKEHQARCWRYLSMFGTRLLPIGLNLGA